jgi:predicted Zn-dependent protease
MDQPELEKVLRYHEAILLTHAGEFDRALQKFVWFLRGSMPTPILLTALGLAALRAPLLPGDVPVEQRDLYVMAGTAAFYQMSGDIAHAQQAMQTLLQRYPSAHHVHYLYACSLLAGDPERAIDEFERELRNTPDSEGTLTMLSWALLNRADAASARPYAQRAITRDRPSTLAQYVYGRSLVETGDVEAGIKYLEKAEHSDPDNLEYHLALASAYPKARRYEDARRERRRSLELARNTGASAQR